MRKSLGAALLAAACSFFVLAQLAVAQDMSSQNAQDSKAQAAPVLQIVVESVKEGHSGAHERVETDWAGMFRKHKMPHQLTMTSMTGQGEAWFLTGYASFAAVEDTQKMLGKGPIKAEMDALDMRDGEHRSNSRFMYAVLRKDLSYKPETLDLGKARFVGVTVFRPKLGHTDDFEKGSKVFVEADGKAGLTRPALCYEVVGGSPGEMFIFFEPMESLKSLDNMASEEKAIREAMGGDQYDSMMKGAGDVFTSITYNLYAVNPHMSYMSKDVEDEDPAFWRPKAMAPKTSASMPAKNDKAGQ